jgi:cytochrome c553
MTKNSACKILASVTAAAYLVVAFPVASSAQSVDDLAQVCAGCHGEKGIPVDKTTPVIWGQKRDYILNQLYDFKVGRRANDLMTPVAQSLSKEDMQALATHFSKMAWPDLPQTTPSADDAKTAREVLNSVNCRGCHQANYEGDTVRPRIAGQQDEYLLKTMNDFRNGDRKTYIGMTALMKSVHEEALKPVAEYLASLKVPARTK